MQAYQAGNAKFVEQGAKVFTISTDNLPTLKHWSEELKTDVPMLSDFMRTASKKYGTLMEDRGISNRATFVIGPDGTIQHIEEGGSAIEITGALNACSRTKGKNK